MSDKNSVVPNICTNLPPPSTSGNEALWATSDYHHENGLPVIGSCQVSSILSTLERGQPKVSSSESKTINTEETSNPLENMETFKSIPINIINADTALAVEEAKKRNKYNSSDIVLHNKLFQEMVYFGCNLCPFICTKDSKITDHIKSVHSSKNSNKKPPLKCPGCPNIFYHKLSLKSHLNHDHEVGRSDINKIVNSIVYVSVLSKNDSNTNENEEKQKMPGDFLPVDLNMEDENLENHSEEDHLETINFLDKEQEPPKLSISEQPVVKESDDYFPKREEKEPFQVNEFKQLNNALRRDSMSKSNEEQKKTQKCYVSTCAVRMQNVVNMAYHIKCHYGKVFRCVECETNFVAWKTLQTHLWRSHQIDMELYSCDKCDYKTYSLAKLNNIHKLIHGNEKSFICDLCGKGFKNPKQMRNHKIIHKVKNPDKLHKCTVCDRTFADRRMLKIHVSGVHQKIKPFSCTYCGYKASSNGALKLHIRQHTGEKPFTCDHCEYSTADHNSLRRHKSRHSGEKKYKCAHCDYACIQSSTYKRHLKTKHPGLENEHMFSCLYCQFRSVSKDKYMIHLASHKEKKKPPQQKIIDIIEDICEETEGLEERVVEIVSLNAQNKKVTNAVEYINLDNMKAETFEEPPDTDFNITECKDQDPFSLHQKMYRVPKKQKVEDPSLRSDDRIQETPVALISKMNNTSTSNHCIILSAQNDDILNLTNVATDNSVLPTTTTISQNNIQYYYSSPNVLFQIIDEKK